MSPAPGASQGRTPGRSARRECLRVRVCVSKPAYPYPRPRVCPRVSARLPPVRCGGQGADEGRGPGRGANTRDAHRSSVLLPRRVCAPLPALWPPAPFLSAAVVGSQVTWPWGQGSRVSRGACRWPSGGTAAPASAPSGSRDLPKRMGSGSPGCVGAGADPDLARPTAGSGAREALAARRPRPTDRPEAGPRKPTCQSYRPTGWAWEASQRNRGTPWGARLRRDSGVAPGGLVGDPQLRPGCAGAGWVPGPVPGPTGRGVFVWASRRTRVCRELDWASWCWMHFHSLRWLLNSQVWGFLPAAL